MAKYLEQLRSVLKEQPIVGNTGFGEIYNSNLPEGITIETLKTLNEYRNDFGQALSERLIEFHQTDMKGAGNVMVKTTTADAIFHTNILGGDHGERLVKSRMSLDSTVLKQNIDLKYTLFNFDMDSKEFLGNETPPADSKMKLVSMEDIVKHAGVDEDKDSIMESLQCVFTDLIEDADDIDIIINS